MRVIAVAALALLLAGCGGGGGGGGGADDPFAFDAGKPLDVRQVGSSSVAGARVRDISFAGSDDRVPAYLVEPETPGPHPAVVLLHPAGASRDYFLSEAVALAGRGAVALTLTSGYERSTDPRVVANREPVSVDRRIWVRSVVDVRRALELLRARDDVDPDRLGILGYSRGSVWGSLAAAVEHPAAVVLMGAPARLSVRVQPASDRGLVEPLDPVHWIGKAAPAHLLVQGGRDDEVVPPEAVRALYAAAAQPKQMRWYPTGHEFSAGALRDGFAFLLRELGLS